MVDFFDITFDEDWIYADAVDYDLDAKGKVKFSRHTDDFYTDCIKDNFFRKGMIIVRKDINKGKLGQHSRRTVCWY